MRRIFPFRRHNNSSYTFSDTEDDQSPNSELLGEKHKRMLKIADIAYTLSWFIAIAVLLQTMFSLVHDFETIKSLGHTGLVYAFDILILTVNNTISFVKGITCVLVLQGVTAGLDILVDISLNYKLNSLQGQ
jgi:hypothetical protein